MTGHEVVRTLNREADFSQQIHRSLELLSRVPKFNISVSRQAHLCEMPVFIYYV